MSFTLVKFSKISLVSSINFSETLLPTVETDFFYMVSHQNQWWRKQNCMLYVLKFFRSRMFAVLELYYPSVLKYFPNPHRLWRGSVVENECRQIIVYALLSLVNWFFGLYAVCTILNDFSIGLLLNSDKDSDSNNWMQLCDRSHLLNVLKSLLFRCCGTFHRFLRLRSWWYQDLFSVKHTATGDTLLAHSAQMHLFLIHSIFQFQACFLFERGSAYSPSWWFLPRMRNARDVLDAVYNLNLIFVLLNNRWGTLSRWDSQYLRQLFCFQWSRWI